jgi:hypothetical protein
MQILKIFIFGIQEENDSISRTYWPKFMVGREAFDRKILAPKKGKFLGCSVAHFP